MDASTVNTYIVPVVAGREVESAEIGADATRFCLCDKAGRV